MIADVAIARIGRRFKPRTVAETRIRLLTRSFISGAEVALFRMRRAGLVVVEVQRGRCYWNKSA